LRIWSISSSVMGLGPNPTQTWGQLLTTRGAQLPRPPSTEFSGVNLDSPLSY